MKFIKTNIIRKIKEWLGISRKKPLYTENKEDFNDTNHAYYKDTNGVDLNIIYKHIEMVHKENPTRMKSIIDLLNVKIDNELSALIKSSKDDLNELQRYRANIRAFIHIRESLLWTKGYTARTKVDKDFKKTLNEL